MALSASLTRDDVVSLWKERRLAFLQPSYAPSRRRSRRARSRAERCDPAHSVLKRLFDRAVASAALLFLAPLLIGIAIAIKLTSSGPVFFSHARYGYRNHRFHIYKFRTMHTHLCDASGTRQTVDGDTRTTRLGRFLRKTSLDELPQLINVVKGEMSLVGPRPHVPGMLAATVLYEDLVPYYFHRHAALPGITGLAQISGCRGTTAKPDAAINRIDYDLEYIERWSLWLDIKIIAQTVRREFISGNAV
jgi:lipopolysaccharide/colanic/teichoic acid biosynthesis glycosyltransferase